MKCEGDALPKGPRAGWCFLQPLPGRGGAAAAHSRPFMSPCSWEWAVPINTTGGSRASAKQAAAQPRDFELFAALLSLYPCQLTHTWDFTSCLPTAAPFSPCDLILTTPAPLQSSESHPHLASIRPGELWTRPTRFMPGTVHSHSFHGKLGGIKVYCEEKLELTINQLGHLGIKLNWTWDLGSTMESNSFFGMVHVLDHGNKTQNSRHLPSLPIDSGLAILKHSKGWGKYCSLGFWSECRPSIQQSYFAFLLSKKSLRRWGQ